MMITRSITKFEVTAYKLYVDHGVPKLEKIGAAEVEGTRCDKTMARKAIADATIARDAATASAALRDHLQKTTRILIASEVVKAHEAETA